ncbi:AAA family ATPase [Embleya sp. MST-111070]|uniref:AAA family ATPase n=1 Tax=Embleya sp. MST-111070 TaxID=3398231 RepID=UPI003F73B0DC
MFITRIALDTDATLPETWPFTMAPVRQLAAEGLDFDRPLTFLVGENGSGKSTIVEAIAGTARISSHGGKAGTKYAGAGAPTPLGAVLRPDLTKAGARLIGGPRLKRRGFFLRAETLFDLGQNVSGWPGFWEQDLTKQSHGEGFMTVFDAMLREPGLYLMDEPEAALSFTSCLTLVGLMHELATTGSQIICATHSPILAATPDADIVEVGDHGIRHTTWDALQLVDHWRRFMQDPQAYLRHIVTAPPQGREGR